MMAHEFLAKATNNIGYVWYADDNGGDNRYADMGRTGASVVAHAVSPLGGAAFERYAKKSARCIGEYPKTFPDTHGSPILGMGWTALGASFDEKAIRPVKQSPISRHNGGDQYNVLSTPAHESARWPHAAPSRMRPNDPISKVSLSTRRLLLRPQELRRRHRR